MAVLVATPLAVVAADAFTDVPDSNVFHDDIAWLADAGVTKGCNPPDNTEFCPSDNVTREQMAAFMRRLAENKVVDAATAETADHATTADTATTADSASTADSATTAGDADTLDGFDADELVRGAGAVATVNSSSATTDSLITIEAPSPGGVLVILSLNCASFGGSTDTRWDVDITVDDVAVNSRGILLGFPHSVVTGTPFASATTSAFAPIPEGTATIGYSAVPTSGNGSLDCDITATAQFMAFDGGGLTPASSAAPVTGHGAGMTD